MQGVSTTHPELSVGGRYSHAEDVCRVFHTSDKGPSLAPAAIYNTRPVTPLLVFLWSPDYALHPFHPGEAAPPRRNPISVHRMWVFRMRAAGSISHILRFRRITCPRRQDRPRTHGRAS